MARGVATLLGSLAVASAASGRADTLNVISFLEGPWSVFAADGSGSSSVFAASLNFTASTDGGHLLGSMYLPVNRDMGRLVDEVLGDVEVEIESTGEQEPTIVWRDSLLHWTNPSGSPSGIVSRRFSLRLQMTAPGVFAGRSEAATAMIALPKFAMLSVHRGEGSWETLTLKKADAVEEKTWIQRYGTVLLMGALFLGNIIVRSYFGNSWARRLAQRDSARGGQGSEYEDVEGEEGEGEGEGGSAPAEGRPPSKATSRGKSSLAPGSTAAASSSATAAGGKNKAE